MVRPASNSELASNDFPVNRYISGQARVSRISDTFHGETYLDAVEGLRVVGAAETARAEKGAWRASQTPIYRLAYVGGPISDAFRTVFGYKSSAALPAK